MSGGAKPLASLSSGLLARKGHARPAMRPQGGAGFIAGTAAAGDDLGWNDMGAAAPVVSVPPTRTIVAPLPPVLVEREALKEKVEQAVATPDVAAGCLAGAPPIAPEVVARIGREAARTGKAAFTLRLPADRHLRLRLASAVRHRSAQAIVTDALDAFLRTLPDVEELARRCPTPERAESRS